MAFISVNISVLDNGNFREFFVERGGEFFTFETRIPGGPDFGLPGYATGTIAVNVTGMERGFNAGMQTHGSI